MDARVKPGHDAKHVSLFGSLKPQTRVIAPGVDGAGAPEVHFSSLPSFFE
jgi:hypothetical protein